MKRQLVSPTFAVFIVLSGFLNAQPIEGELIYTRHRTDPGNLGRVKRVSFSYENGELSFGEKITIVSQGDVGGADGVVFAPSTGHIVIGGQGPVIYDIDASVNPATVVSYPVESGDVNIFHLMVNPEGTTLWGAALPGRLAEFSLPLIPGETQGTRRDVQGDDSRVTQLTWVGDVAYYTSSGARGTGSFGTIDLETLRTTRLISNLEAAHGMSYDPYTGDLLLFGGTKIAQIQPDPQQPTIRSMLDVSDSGAIELDQGAANGDGLIFVAETQVGLLVFVDYSASQEVGQADAVKFVMLDTWLDDVAPLVGPGSDCDSAFDTYGEGWPGTRGIPTLEARTDPVLGSSFQFFVGNSSGQTAHTCIGFADESASESTAYGGTKLLGGGLHIVSADVQPEGSVLSFLLPDRPELCGRTVFIQALQVDSGASHGYSFTPGLRVILGQN